MASDLIKKLQASDSIKWDPSNPFSSKEIKDLEETFKLNLPNDYKEILMEAGEVQVYGDTLNIHFESPWGVKGLNTSPHITDYLSDQLIFGDDGGSYFYVYDPKNKWGKGKYAIFRCSNGQHLPQRRSLPRKKPHSNV